MKINLLIYPVLTAAFLVWGCNSENSTSSGQAAPPVSGIAAGQAWTRVEVRSQCDDSPHLSSSTGPCLGSFDIQSNGVIRSVNTNSTEKTLDSQQLQSLQTLIESGLGEEQCSTRDEIEDSAQVTLFFANGSSIKILDFNSSNDSLCSRLSSSDQEQLMVVLRAAA